MFVPNEEKLAKYYFQGFKKGIESLQQMLIFNPYIFTTQFSRP